MPRRLRVPDVRVPRTQRVPPPARRHVPECRCTKIRYSASWNGPFGPSAAEMTKMATDTEKIQVASKTYHACAREIEEAFGLSVPGWLTPRERFHLTLAAAVGGLHTSNIQNGARPIDDFSKVELRSA